MKTSSGSYCNLWQIPVFPDIRGNYKISLLPFPPGTQSESRYGGYAMCTWVHCEKCHVGWSDDRLEHVTNFGVWRCHRLNGFVLFYNTLYFNIPSRPNTSLATRTASTQIELVLLAYLGFDPHLILLFCSQNLNVLRTKMRNLFKNFYIFIITKDSHIEGCRL
jgi:hypothetical protein